MTLHTFNILLMQSYKNPEVGKCIIGVVYDMADRTRKIGYAAKATYDAGRVALYGNRHFLPAAREWQKYIKGDLSGISPERIKELRGRLGGTSRWLYARQEASFKDLCHLIGVPQEFSNWAWKHIKNLERDLLSHSRDK